MNLVTMKLLVAITLFCGWIHSHDSHDRTYDSCGCPPPISAGAGVPDTPECNHCNGVAAAFVLFVFSLQQSAVSRLFWC